MFDESLLINEMYGYLPNTIFGFHGCDISTYKKVIFGNEPLLESNNKEDWLGKGIYFWENNYERAAEWASTHCKTEPAVIGAVINLGYCLNLLDSKYIAILKDEYELLRFRFALQHKVMPVNKGGKDRLRRLLDRAVIEQLHESREDNGEYPFDSVRGAFWEGEPIYPTAGFKEQSHIQICIRNPNCIKGYFIPRALDKKWNKV